MRLPLASTHARLVALLAISALRCGFPASSSGGLQQGADSLGASFSSHASSSASSSATPPRPPKRRLNHMSDAKNFHKSPSVPTMGTRAPFPSALVTGWPRPGKTDLSGITKRTTTGQLQSDERAIYHDYVQWGVPTSQELVDYGDDFGTAYQIERSVADATVAEMTASQVIYQGSQWPRQEIEALSPFGARLQAAPGSGASYTSLPKTVYAKAIAMPAGVALYKPENTEYFIETYTVERVNMNINLNPEPVHGVGVVAGRRNDDENIYKYGFNGQTGADNSPYRREHPNPSQGIGRNIRTPSAEGDYHTLWQYQGQLWPRVEALTNQEARARQHAASAQAAENAASVAGTAKHNLAYSTGEWNGHVRLEGYYGVDARKNKYSTLAGAAATLPMVDVSHHEFQFKSREASKYSYMRGVGCFPASTSTSYTLAYAASSASETMASTHRAENGAGLMSGAAWFANEVFAGPNEWFQIEFQAPSLVDAITTTGGGAALPFWVSSYTFSHSSDNTGANGGASHIHVIINAPIVASPTDWGETRPSLPPIHNVNGVIQRSKLTHGLLPSVLRIFSFICRMDHVCRR